MNFVPYYAKNLFYRKETNGITLVFTKENGVKFLNPTSSYIFNCINGTRSYSEIVEKMKNEYSDVADDVIENDTLDCLYSLKTMDFIKWKQEVLNPVNSLSNSLVIDNKVEMAGEQDYLLISKYILKNFNKDIEQGYMTNIPVQNKGYYRDISIRTRQFNLSEICTFTKENDKITSIISVTGFNSPHQAINLGLFIYELKYLNDFMRNYFYLENILTKKGKIKLKFNMMDNELNNKKVQLIESLGFSKEGILEKEINGINMHVYKKILLEERLNDHK